MDPPDLRECILCGNRYARTSVGVLACRVHPLPVNHRSHGDRHRIDHRECCGASADPGDRAHYETEHPLGCHRIDHVASAEELEGVFDAPYACIPASGVRRPRPVHPPVLVDSEDLLKCFYPFRAHLGRTIHIDVGLEHRRLSPAAVATEDATALRSSSRFYDYDRPGAPPFRPFWIVRRMDFCVDPAKEAELRAAAPCPSGQ